MFQIKNKWKNILAGCLTIFGILIPSAPCLAENIGSIQIEYQGRTQENEEVIFADAKFSVFLVGKMEDGKWTLTGDFSNAEVSLEGIESSERNEQAKQLYEYAVEHHIQGNDLKTDRNGIAAIGGLEQGVYLVAQTQVWTSEGKGSVQASPYLLSIPEEIDGSYVWDVVTKPKSEWIPQQPQPETPTEPTEPDKNTETENSKGAQTGDTSSLIPVLFLLTASLGTAIVLYRKRKKY